jgi:hypothetical protein
MNTDNIIRAIISALPDDFFKEELARRGLVAETDDVLWASIQNKHAILAKVDDYDLWRGIEDPYGVLESNLSILEDDTLWDALQDPDARVQDALDQQSTELLWDAIQDKEEVVLQYIHDCPHVLCNEYLWESVQDKDELVNEYLKDEGNLMAFLSAQSTTDLREALAAKDEPLNYENVYSAIVARTFNVKQTVNLMHAMLNTL